MSASATSEQKEPKKSSTCTNCRERHLKCDGGPICTRCKTERTACIFVPSRRGQRKPSSNNRRHELDGGLGKDTTRGGGPNRTIWTTPIVSGAGKPPDFSASAPERLAPEPRAQDIGSQLDRNRAITSVHLIGLFYSYFFNTHPFVLPRTLLLETFSKNECPQLQAAVEYVGACYDSAVNSKAYMEAVTQQLFVSSPPANGYTVQALLLIGIASHGSNDKEKALDVVRRAATIAQELGMQNAEFAKTYGNGNVTLEESWRRTFWELYIVERVIAAESHTPESIVVTGTTLTVPLPCEENEYLNGRGLRLRTLEDYDNRAFLGDDIVFASAAYRIDAARILGNTLILAANPPTDEPYVDKLDHELGQWYLYLPDEKRTIVAKDWIYDEVLFHAHALSFCAAMYLHKPRSHMATFKFQNSILDCYPRTPPNVSASTHSASYHTAFLLRAAESIAKLVDIPRGSSAHTPLFSFCLFLSAATYLAASPLLSAGQDGPSDGTVLGTNQVHIRRQIGFEISALKKMSKVWSSAKQAMEDIQTLSVQYFNATSPPKSSPGSSDAMTDVVSNGNFDAI